LRSKKAGNPSLPFFCAFLRDIFSLAIFFRPKFSPRSKKCQNNFVNIEKVFVNFVNLR